MDLKQTYNRIASDWGNDHNSDTWWQKGTDIFLSHLPLGAHVLDLGCGAGIKTRYIANKGFKVTGTDFSEKMIELAKKECPRVDFEVWDLFEIGSFPRTFDAIFANAVLLHVPKARVVEVLQKIKGRINTGGFLYIAVKGIKDDGLEEKVIKESDYGYDYERFFSFFSLEELKGYVAAVGMELVYEAKTTSGRAEWLQVVAKKV